MSVPAAHVLIAATTPGPHSGPVRDLAAQLRRLRESAGSPSFRTMARQVHFSPSTLAEAVQGRRLPTPAVVEAFAAACGADPATWVGKRRDAAARVTTEADPAPGSARPLAAFAADPAERPVPTGRTAWIATRNIAVVLIAAAAGFALRPLIDRAARCILVGVAPRQPPVAV